MPSARVAWPTASPAVQACWYGSGDEGWLKGGVVSGGHQPYAFVSRLWPFDAKYVHLALLFEDDVGGQTTLTEHVGEHVASRIVRVEWSSAPGSRFQQRE